MKFHFLIIQIVLSFCLYGQIDSVLIQNIPLAKNDTIHIDTVSQDTFIVRAGYMGNRGCHFPEISIDSFQKTLTDLLFESERYEAISDYSFGKCLTVEQISILVKQFDFEDFRLSFLTSDLFSIYDSDRKNFLLPLLKMEKSQHVLKQYFVKYE